MSDYLSDDNILARLDTERRALLAQLEGVSPAVQPARPSPERWSIAETLEHLGRIETGVTMLLTARAASPPPADAERPRPEAQVTPSVAAHARDRSRRIEAPERVRPGGKAAAHE